MKPRSQFHTAGAADGCFATQLAEAEAAGLQLAELSGLLPGNGPEAAIVQQQIVERSGLPIAGWKVAIHPDHGPVAAPITRAARAADGIATFDYGSAEALEVEVAFRLARDLAPLPDGDHTESTILDHVASVHTGVEFIAHRLNSHDRRVFPLFLADRLGNGGYVLGPELERAAVMKLAAGAAGQAGEIRLSLDHGAALAIDAAHPDGNPFNPLLAFLNGRGKTFEDHGFWRFRAGQFVTTGSFSGVVPLSGSRHVSVDWFGGFSVAR